MKNGIADTYIPSIMGYIIWAYFGFTGLLGSQVNPNTPRLRTGTPIRIIAIFKKSVDPRFIKHLSNYFVDFILIQYK